MKGDFFLEAGAGNKDGATLWSVWWIFFDMCMSFRLPADKHTFLHLPLTMCGGVDLVEKKHCEKSKDRDKNTGQKASEHGKCSVRKCTLFPKKSTFTNASGNLGKPKKTSHSGTRLYPHRGRSSGCWESLLWRFGLRKSR